MTYVGIILTFVFINNIVLNQTLGVCPFIGASRKNAASLGLGFAVVVVSTFSSLATWAVDHGLLLPLKIGYLRTVVFILILSGMIKFLEAAVKKMAPALEAVLGYALPLVTTNCAVFGITLIAVKNSYSLLESVTAGFAAGLGFLLASVLLDSLRDTLRREWIPKAFQGAPITFVSAGLMALAFMAFDKALLKNIVG